MVLYNFAEIVIVVVAANNSLLSQSPCADYVIPVTFMLWCLTVNSCIVIGSYVLPKQIDLD
jgi:hypothetical protein